MPTSSLAKPVAERPTDEAASYPDRREIGPAHLSLGRADIASLIAAVVSLIAACVIASARKPFWNDEINVWMPATDPSLRHMFWAAAHACSGGNSPVYLLLLRAWMSVAGNSALSVRLFSCLGFCLAMVVLWITLRRHLRFPAVAFALLTVWCTSELFFQQMVEARAYGFYALAAALAIAAFDSIARSEEISRWRLAATALASAVLVSAHYFGILYSGLMLVALLTSDRMQQRFRLRYYAAIIAGWLVLLPWLPAMRRDAALLGERSYFRLPTAADLAQSFRFGVSYLPLLAFITIVFLAVAVLRDHESEKSSGPRSPRIRPLVILGLAWMLLPLIAFLIFQLAPRPVFMERYMLPSAVGFAVVLAVGADTLLEGARLPAVRSLRTSGQGIMALCWVALFALLPLAPLQQARTTAYPDSIVPTVSKLAPPGIPVVMAWQWEFLQANFYARQEPPRYFYVLDREMAMSPDSAIDEPLFFNERTAWKNAGYWADRTLESNAFLCRYERFAVLDAPRRLWFTRRVLHNPAFEVESIMPVDGRYFAVVHRAPGANLSCNHNQPLMNADKR